MRKHLSVWITVICLFGLVSAFSGCAGKQTHKHTAMTIQGKSATCTETGLTDGVVCSDCGAVIEEQYVIPKQEHIPEKLSGKAATCTSTGLTDGVICLVCGEVLVKQRVIA